MIILRQKNNSRTFDPLPNPFSIPIEWIGKYDKITIRVDYTKRYFKEIQLFGEVERKLIKSYIKDLKAGYYYIDGPSGGVTHYLSKKSKPDQFHRMTKDINISDRFDYLVYPPELNEKDREVIIPIKIQSLKDHNIAGQGLYSDTEEN